MSKEILAQFESATREFVALAKSIPAEKLNFVSDPGEWSAGYVIHHVADCDAQFMVRFLNILCEENPAIVPFNEEIFPSRLRYDGRHIQVSLSAIESSTLQVVDILGQLGSEEWSRTGVHIERGFISLSDVLQTTTNHRAEHLDQIRQLSTI